MSSNTWGWLGAAAIATCFVPTALFARSLCAPTGGDRDAVAAARRAVEAGCRCDGFATHAAFVSCVRRAVRVEAAAGRLPIACQRDVRRALSRSTCSYSTERVTCCTEEPQGERSCRITSASACRSIGSHSRTICSATPFCADTRCERDTYAATCGPELLYGAEGNRLRRYDLDTVRQPPLVDDVLIERASQGGLDINGQICPIPDGSGRFVAGEDTGQPAIPAGFGVFDAAGVRIGKLRPTFQTELPGATSNDEPFGCAFDGPTRLFTTDVGNQASGPGNGQLVLWFPPFDVYPGAPLPYPNAAVSTNYCKLATDIATAGTVAVDEQGRVYVASARGGVIYRFSPPFPTGPDAAGGCGGIDATGAPVATTVHREVFASGRIYSGIARARNGNWFFSSVFLGTIDEHDASGALLRTVLQPAPGETTYPLSVGHPQGLAVDCEGDLYYADLAIRISPGGIGPGPNGTVRRVPFDVCGQPASNVIVKDRLAFPDALGIVPGDLEP